MQDSNLPPACKALVANCQEPAAGVKPAWFLDSWSRARSVAVSSSQDFLTGFLTDRKRLELWAADDAEAVFVDVPIGEKVE